MSTDADPRPLYQQLADDLRRRIRDGEYEAGGPIPSESALREQHRISRDTVRKALHELTQEGILTTGRGRVRLVRDYRPLRWSLSTFEGRNHHVTHPNNDSDAWGTEVATQGRSPSETIELLIVEAPAGVASRLKLSSGETVVVRRRVRYVDQTPYQLADSYFPEPLVRGTPLMEPRSVNAPGGLLAVIGHPQVRFVDEIQVRMPTQDETSRLELPAGTPVAEVTRTGYADDDSPLRVMISVAPGDRNVLVYEIDAT